MYSNKHSQTSWTNLDAGELELWKKKKIITTSFNQPGQCKTTTNHTGKKTSVTFPLTSPLPLQLP